MTGDRTVVVRRWSTALTLAGLVVMIGSGIWAQRYTGFWFDPDEGCAVHDRCEDPAMLAVAWWLVGAGAVILLAGVVARWVAAAGRPPTVASTPHQPPRRGRVEAAVLTAIGAVLIGAATFTLGVGFGLVSAQLGVAVVAVFWLVQAHAVAAVARSVRSATSSPRLAWATGIVASTVAVAVGAAAVVAIDSPSNDWGLAVLAWAGAVTMVGLACWVPGWRAG